MFERSAAGGVEWRQTARLTADTPSEGDLFGFRSSVAIRGDAIAVGALGSDAARPDAGIVYLFQRNSATSSLWEMRGKLVANDPVEFGNYGQAVSLSRDELAVGASSDGTSTVDAGLVYVTPAAGTNVTIDIAPGVFPNSVNVLQKNGVIDVAILTTAVPLFDATTIDVTMTRFGKTGTENLEQHGTVHFQDVDGDGDTDAVMRFVIGGSGLLCSDTMAALQGKTLGGPSSWASTPSIPSASATRCPTC